MRILVTEMAGRASVELKGRELGVDLDGQADAIGRVVDQVKVLEADGWSFEAADASFELLLRAQLPGAPAPLFELESYKTSVEHWGNGVVVSEATVKVHARTASGSSRTAEGNGPVNALDNALRQALVGRYPQLAEVSLADYKVRILGWKGGTERHHPGAHRHHRRRGGVDHRRACTPTSSRPPGTRCVDALTYAVRRRGRPELEPRAARAAEQAEPLPRGRRARPALLALPDVGAGGAGASSRWSSASWSRRWR